MTTQQQQPDEPPIDICEMALGWAGGPEYVEQQRKQGKVCDCKVQDGKPCKITGNAYFKP